MLTAATMEAWTMQVQLWGHALLARDEGWRFNPATHLAEQRLGEEWGESYWDRTARDLLGESLNGAAVPEYFALAAVATWFARRVTTRPIEVI